MGPYIVCLVTVDDPSKAALIATQLVENSIVACVNIVQGIRSIYQWKGEVCDDTECLMIMKTKRDLFGDLEAMVKELHPYEVPEIIALPIECGLPEYLKWIDDNTLGKS